jgi:hypothetical protein
MGWCCCSEEQEDFAKASSEAHNNFNGSVPSGMLETTRCFPVEKLIIVNESCRNSVEFVPLKIGS